MPPRYWVDEEQELACKLVLSDASEQLPDVPVAAELEELRQFSPAQS